jgi:hypothetical protein
LPLWEVLLIPEVDWFSQQNITLTNSNIQWNNIAQAPGTSAFAEPRGSRFDEVHVVLIDDLGTITGNAGTILEKHLGLSKATDAEFSAGSTSYWRKYIAAGSAKSLLVVLLPDLPQQDMMQVSLI